VFTERASVGLDVHARSKVAAAVDGVTGEAFRPRLTPGNDEARLTRTCPGEEARARCPRHRRDEEWNVLRHSDDQAVHDYVPGQRRQHRATAWRRRPRRRLAKGPFQSPNAANRRRSTRPHRSHRQTLRLANGLLTRDRQPSPLSPSSGPLRIGPLCADAQDSERQPRPRSLEADTTTDPAAGTVAMAVCRELLHIGPSSLTGSHRRLWSKDHGRGDTRPNPLRLRSA